MYHILYVENSVSKLKSFNTYEERFAFIVKFKEDKNLGDGFDNKVSDWIQLLFQGVAEYTDGIISI